MLEQVKAVFVLGTVILLLSFSILLIMERAQQAYASRSIKVPATLTNFAALTAMPTASDGTSENASELDPTTIAAIIGLAGVILGLIVAIATTIYQTRRSERLQRELSKQNEQSQRDLSNQNEQLQRDLVQIQQKLQREYVERDRQEQQEQSIRSTDTKRQRILRTSTDEERLTMYREALLEDPRITTIQILNMQRPLEVTNVYVRLRIHSETPTGYDLPSIHQETYDPNEMLQQERLRKELRFETALDPEQAIRKYKHCVIVGDPGAGKTTLLKHLTIATVQKPLSNRSEFVPIYVELQEFIRSRLPDLLDFIATKWAGWYAFPPEQARLLVANCLDQGNALLLLDALDETVVGETPEAAENSYTAASQAILQLATCYSKATIVITARKSWIPTACSSCWIYNLRSYGLSF